MFIQLHQITLQTKNNINKNEINEKHFYLKKLKKNSLKKAAAISLRSADIWKSHFVTHKHKKNVTYKIYNNSNNIRNNLRQGFLTRGARIVPRGYGDVESLRLVKFTLYVYKNLWKLARAASAFKHPCDKKYFWTFFTYPPAFHVGFRAGL